TALVPRSPAPRGQGAVRAAGLAGCDPYPSLAGGGNGFPLPPSRFRLAPKQRRSLTMAWLRTRFQYLSRRLRRLWAVVSAHHHGATFALCALALMAASMVNTIAGWTGLLPRPLAYAVGTGVQGFILYFAILLVA